MTTNTTTQVDENELAKRASKKHHEHLAKAKHHLGKAMECHKAAMECVAKLAKMHHAHHEAHKAAGEHEFDHGAAAKLIARLHGHHSDTHDHHELAHHHLSMAHEAGGNVHHAGGRSGQGEGTVEDPHKGTKTPEGELETLLQHIMTEGHVPGLNDGSGPSKAAGGEGSALEQLLKAVQEAGYYKGKAEALEKLPANTGSSPRNFDFSSIGFNSTNDGEDPRMAAVKKAAGAVDMNDPQAREAAAARVLGTMVGNPSMFAQGMDEGGFRGQAGTK